MRGMQFSTYDADNDRYPWNCASDYLGGWWFNCCHHAFLNGPWLPISWTYHWGSQYKRGTNVNGTSMLIK